jgi:type I restriction enzyme S subunit
MKKAPATKDLEESDDPDLPEGWSHTLAADLITWSSGKFLPKKRQKHGAVPIYGGNGIAGYHNTSLVTVPTLIVGRVGALCGNVYLSERASWVTDNAIYGTSIAPDLNLKYLQLLFSQAGLNQRSGGSGQPFVNQEILNSVRVPLAPKLEQDRIVYSVKQLESLIQQVANRLDKIPKSLKALRQSVLAAACSGRLTEDWRDGNESLPSTDELLEEVLSQRRQSWDVECKAAGRNRKYPNPIAFDQNSDLPAIPETWIWSSADTLCSQITDGEHIQPPYRETGLPMLTAKHVRDGYVVFDDAGLISDVDFKKCLQRCAPSEEDILIVSVGATTGRAAIVEKCPPFAIVRSVLLLRPLIVPQYFLGWIQSPWCFNWMQSASGASAQPHLYINDTRRMPVPLPTLQEQKEIVRRVDALFKLADKIEERVATATKRADKLTQSILAKAFRGELVPTEAELARQESRDYESASALVERIRSDRETAAVTTRRPVTRRN